MANPDDNAADLVTEYVTMTIGDHMFGLPIFRVQDVFVPARVTRVPLAPPEVAGILNLRGRVVTAIDMRSRLDLGARAPGTQVMAIGIELKGEFYGLLVDWSARCCSFGTPRARQTRRISTPACRGWPPASIGSRVSSWSCSTSTACWTSRMAPPLPHEDTFGASKGSKE